jgi:hypothetical protein
MTALITLTTAGTDSGPFNLYSDADGYVTAFATSISKSALLAGYTSTVVPNGSTIIRIKSTGVCTNYIDVTLGGITTTTTTTAAGPTISFVGARTCSFTTAGGGGSSCTGNGTVTITGGSYNLQVYVSIDSSATPLTINEIDATIGTVNLSASTTSQYVADYSANVLFGPGTYNFSYLVQGSGGTNTGGGGGILYQLAP